MQHPRVNLRQHLFGTDATSRTLQSRPHPANAPPSPLDRIDEDQEMHDSTSLPPATENYNMNAGEGPSSSNTALNQAASEMSRQDSIIRMLSDELRRWPTDQEIDNPSSERRVQPLATQSRQEADLLPNLLDINRTRTQRRPVIEEIEDEPAESVHELRPRSRTSRRRRHAEAFAVGEIESPLHETRHRRIDTGSRPAQQGYPGNYQPPSVEDATESPPTVHKLSIHRQTNQSPGAKTGNLPRRGGGAPLYCNECRDRTENTLPLRVRSGNGRFRGGGPYVQGSRGRLGSHHYSPYQSSNSGDSWGSIRRPGRRLSYFPGEDDETESTYASSPRKTASVSNPRNNNADGFVENERVGSPGVLENLLYAPHPRPFPPPPSLSPEHHADPRHPSSYADAVKEPQPEHRVNPRTPPRPKAPPTPNPVPSPGPPPYPPPPPPMQCLLNARDAHLLLIIAILSLVALARELHLDLILAVFFMCMCFVFFGGLGWVRGV